MDRFIYSLIDMSLVSVYCVIIVLLLRLFLKKVPKIFSYLLWAVVFLRLILPIFPEAPVSLVPQALRVTNSAQMLENANQPTQIDQVSPNLATVAPLEIAADKITLDKDANTDAMSNGTAATSSSQDSSKLSANTSPSGISTGTILFMIWASGFALIGLYNVTSYFVLRRKTRDAIDLGDYLISNRIDSPFVIGILKPRIYLPDGLAPQEREFVLAHEKTHIRRFDYLIKLTAFFIVSVHWFNPVVWLAFVLMNRDMEMSCDEAVIRSLGISFRKEYSKTLISMATGRNLFRPVPLAFGEGNIKMRIQNVLNYKKPTVWIIVVSLLMVVGISAGLFLNPMNSVAARDTDAQSSQADTLASDDTASTGIIGMTIESENNPFNQMDDSQRDFLLHKYTEMNVVDLSGFSNLLTAKGYTVTQSAGPSAGDQVFTATDADQMSSIVYTEFADAEDAYLAMDSYILDLYETYRAAVDSLELETPSDNPAILGQETAIFAYDSYNLYGDNSFHIACLSGNHYIEAVIPIDTEYRGQIESDTFLKGVFPLKADRLALFVRVLEDLGLGYPGKVEPNSYEALARLPAQANIGSMDEFLDEMTAELYSVITSSDNQIEMTDTEQKINVTYRLLSDSETVTMESLYVMPLFNGCSSTFYETDSYQVFSVEDPEGISIWICKDNRLIQFELVWLGCHDDYDMQELRFRFETLYKKICF